MKDSCSLCPEKAHSSGEKDCPQNSIVCESEDGTPEPLERGIHHKKAYQKRRYWILISQNCDAGRHFVLCTVHPDRVWSNIIASGTVLSCRDDHVRTCRKYSQEDSDKLGILSQRMSISDLVGQGRIIRDSLHWGSGIENHHDNKSISCLDQSMSFNSDSLRKDLQVNMILSGQDSQALPCCLETPCQAPPLCQQVIAFTTLTPNLTGQDFVLILCPV